MRAHVHAGTTHSHTATAATAAGITSAPTPAARLRHRGCHAPQRRDGLRPRRHVGGGGGDGLALVAHAAHIHCVVWSRVDLGLQALAVGAPGHVQQERSGRRRGRRRVAGRQPLCRGGCSQPAGQPGSLHVRAACSNEPRSSRPVRQEESVCGGAGVVLQHNAVHLQARHIRQLRLRQPGSQLRRPRACGAGGGGGRRMRWWRVGGYERRAWTPAPAALLPQHSAQPSSSSLLPLAHPWQTQKRQPLGAPPPRRLHPSLSPQPAGRLPRRRRSPPRAAGCLPAAPCSSSALW